MPANNSELKSRVLGEVQEAFQKGVSSTLMAPGVQSSILDYWERCFEANKDEIRNNWDKGGGAKAIEKVTAMGQRAANAAASKDGVKEITLDDFHTARREVNSVMYNQTGWCILEE